MYFREQVQDELREIFEAQYELTLTEEVEIRYRTETSTDPETGETTTEEVPYEYYILNVTLTNKTLPAVILPRLNEQQREIYTVMQQLKGNKPYLWEGIYNGGEDMDILRTQSTCQYVDAKSTHFWLPSLRAGLSK